MWKPNKNEIKRPLLHMNIVKRCSYCGVVYWGYTCPNCGKDVNDEEGIQYFG